MAEFSIDKFKYRWQGDWTTATAYRRDDIIRVGGKSYVCLIAHTSNALFRADLNATLPGSTPPEPQPKWVVMTSGRTFLGNWATETVYDKGDIVNFQGSLYICSYNHTSDTFTADAPNVDDSIQPVNQNWTLFVAGQQYLQTWTIDTDYGLNAVVKYGGIVYQCIQTHNSTGSFETTLENWKIVYEGYQYKAVWVPNTVYIVNDLVRYGASIFKCTESHTAGSEQLDEDKFELELLGSQFDSVWSPLVAYNQGDVVRYGGTLYYAANNNLDSNPSSIEVYDSDDSTINWVLLSKTYNFRGQWGRPKNLTETLIVKIGVDTVDSKATGNIYIDGVEQASLSLFKGRTYIFDQSLDSNATYDDKTNPIGISTRQNGVAGGGAYYEDANPTAITYIIDRLEVSRAEYYDNFLTATTRQVVLSVPTTETLTLYYFSGVNLSMGGSMTIASPATTVDAYAVGYKTGDIVQRGGDIYYAVRDVGIADGDGSSIDYLDPEVWELLVPGKIFSASWNEDIIYSRNEIVTYFGTAYVCNLEHRSAANNFPGDNGSGYDYWDVLVQAGQPGAMLYKGDLLTYGLSREAVGDLSTLTDNRLGIGKTSQLLSVEVDSTSQELEIFWRNVIADSDTIFVAPHGQDEIGFGSSWRTPFKTVRHACEYVEDNYESLELTKVAVSTGRFTEVGPITVPAGCVVMGDELRATTVVASGPQAIYADTFKYIQAYTIRLKQIFPTLITLQTVTMSELNTIIQDKTGPLAQTSSIGVINQLIDDYVAFIDANVGSGDAPTVIGTNTPSSSVSDGNAAAILNRNFEFIAKELILYAQGEFPTETLPEAEMRQDIRHLLRAFTRDLNYTGNWATSMSARRYYNSVLGSKLDDLLYMRDTTGLRNMTTEGLEGTLNPPGVFAQYQRPTGGALVSLDPGWGPDDERCWIMNRSPYMQGVTNIGNSCVGCKVDGALHNGGNRSVVANDFTQVLSDGIGAWVTNNARVELVSVFTYYCQVGYLAENGGVIRATNGNNSYGNFGSIAEGNDATEVPISATVNNQTAPAVVNNAIAGGAADELFIFEYANCGEAYTTADSDIVGAGADANIEYTDFRDGGLFEVRLVNSKGSGSKGGSNYLIRQNSAQVTLDSSVSFTLNVNETTQFKSEIVGMRVVIISGTGIGQYAEISDYDQPSKLLSVIKESDGTPGWEHIIPGTPIEAAIDSTTTYRIEPKITCAAPLFDASEYNPLPNSRQWADIAYGGTTVAYSNIVLTLGTGAIDEDATQIQARINVIRSGKVYEASLLNDGAGYAVGDTITVPGTELGGTSPLNDLTFVVTENSEDSTNSIIAFTTSGTPRDGRYVAVTTDSKFSYSDDGGQWLEGNLPFEGVFVKVVAGLNKFIAVATDTNKVAYSEDGQNWTERSLGEETASWKDCIFGNGKFVIVGEGTQNAMYSSDGLNWAAGLLPVGDDSSGDQWQAVAYGAGRFVAISGSQAKDVAYSANGITWARYNNALPAGDFSFVSLVYGKNRFIGFTNNGEVVMSLNKGATWIAGTDAPTLDGSTTMNWKNIKFAQGVFVAICDTGGAVIGADNTTGPTTYFATTEDCITWTGRNFDYEKSWSVLTFNNDLTIPKWIVFADDETNSAIAQVQVGATAQVRADITSGSFNIIKIWEPGSGYSTANPPTLTIFDTQFITQVETDLRLGDGVLAQPEFIDRGAGYRTSTSTIVIIGDGYADIIPEANQLVLSGVPLPLPGPGVQIRIADILDDTTDDPDDLKLFVGVKATDLGDDGSGNNTRNVQFQITPTIDNEFNLEHATAATLRTRYSQCRISGHDFLDIGTGNFLQTNYPALYAGGSYFTSAPENEILEVEGGRVFYVSTDQDGNFRAGELFGVNQATGVVTISAEFFDLDGLSSLALGGVRLGGTGAAVNEFSTDATFSADSNQVIPTQKAIATFLADRLSVGGSDLETNTITAGQVKIGTENNIIDILSGSYLNIPRVVTFDGADALGNVTDVQGTMLAQIMFFRSFNMQ